MLSTIYDSGECPTIREFWYLRRHQDRALLRQDPQLSALFHKLNSSPRDRLQWRATCRGPFVPIKSVREVLHAGGCQVYGPRSQLP